MRQQGPYDAFELAIRRPGLLSYPPIARNVDVAKRMLAAVDADPAVLEVFDELVPLPERSALFDVLAHEHVWCLSHGAWGRSVGGAWPADPSPEGWRLQGSQDGIVWTLHLCREDDAATNAWKVAEPAPIVSAMRRAHEDARLAGAEVCELVDDERRAVLHVAFADGRRCDLSCDVDLRESLVDIQYGAAVLSDVALTRDTERWACDVIDAVRAGRAVLDTVALAGVRVARVMRLDLGGVPDVHVAGFPFVLRLPGVKTSSRPFEPWRSGA